MMVMHSAHNERKQETIVKTRKIKVQVKKKTLSLHSLQHGLRFNMTGYTTATGVLQGYTTEPFVQQNW